MRVAVFGAGGVGGYFGGLLARAGHDVTFVARGAHLDAIRRHGLTVKSAQAGDFHVTAAATDDPASVGTVDLVLFCVKSQDSESAARACLPLIGPDTLVLTLQNGMENEDLLARIVPREQLLGGVAFVESTIAAPGEVHQLSPGARVAFGELQGPPGERVQRLLEAFRDAGWDVATVDDLRLVLWRKFVGLAAWAGVSALADADYGQIMASPDLRELLKLAIDEGLAVARADGYELGDDFFEKMMAGPVIRPEMKTSLQRDREKGRRLEIEALNGYTVRIGRQHGIPTAVNLCIYACLKQADERAASG